MIFLIFLSRMKLSEVYMRMFSTLSVEIIVRWSDINRTQSSREGRDAQKKFAKWPGNGKISQMKPVSNRGKVKSINGIIPPFPRNGFSILIFFHMNSSIWTLSHYQPKPIKDRLSFFFTGIPFVFVVITLSASFDGYGTNTRYGNYKFSAKATSFHNIF